MEIDGLNPGKFIGEFEVDTTIHPVFANYTPSDWAMEFIESYGQIDGSHHKSWVIDQVARILKGSPVTVVEAVWDSGYKEFRFWTDVPSDEYRLWVKRMLGDVVDDGYEYDYDEGIAP